VEASESERDKRSGGGGSLCMRGEATRGAPAMSIALESGRGPPFGRGGRYSASPPASAGRASSSMGRDSNSPAAAAQLEWDGEEVEGGDGEVQSSYKGSPFDTMDALQEALPYR
jgi:hypothetical protein